VVDPSESGPTVSPAAHKKRSAAHRLHRTVSRLGTDREVFIRPWIRAAGALSHLDRNIE